MRRKSLSKMYSSLLLWGMVFYIIILNFEAKCDDDLSDEKNELQRIVNPYNFHMNGSMITMVLPPLGYNDLLALVVRYSISSRVKYRTLEWDQFSCRFRLHKSWWRIKTFARPTGGNHTRMVAVLDDLPLPNIHYQLEVTEIYKNYVIEHGYVTTTGWAPPKTGAGCFRVLHYGSIYRRVELYWQAVDGVEYDVSAVAKGEDGEWRSADMGVGSGAKNVTEGYLIVLIGLERHVITVKQTTYNAPDLPSTIVVPAHGTLLPPPTGSLFHNQTANTVTISWRKPENVTTASNCTLLWVSLKRYGNPQTGIVNVMYLPPDQTSFEIRQDTLNLGVSTAVSVNSNESSSGFVVLDFAKN